MGIINHLFMGNSFLVDRQEEHRFVRKKSGHILLFPLFLLSFFIVSCDDKYEDLRYEYSDYGIIHKNGELTTIQTDRGALVCPSVWNIPAELNI